MAARPSPVRALGLLVLVVAASVACGPREDVTPQIEVQPGAAARAMALTGKMASGPPPAAPVDAGPPEPPKGKLVFACVEPRGPQRALVRVPCTATFTRLDEAAVFDGGAPLDAGATDDGDGDEDADDEVLAADGKIAIRLAPGEYHVTAARGLEHASAAFDVDLVAGQTTWGPHEGAVTIARVVDTRGYFAADLTSPPFAGDEAQSAAREWIATEAARGIEVVVPRLGAEGTTSFDLEGLVHERKLEAAIVALAPSDLGVLDLGPLEPGTRDAAIADFLARLAAKSPVTPGASGEARTYVRVDDDGATAGWDGARDADFVRGVRELRDVVLTDGPFLRVAANGAGIGALVRPKGGDVAVSVHVECAVGSRQVRVALRHARARDGIDDAKTVKLAPLPTGALGADVTFHVRATKDDAFVVTAAQEREAGGGAGGDEAEPATFAVTGAVWIDADGDGESLGRKTSDVKPVATVATDGNANAKPKGKKKP